MAQPITSSNNIPPQHHANTNQITSAEKQNMQQYKSLISDLRHSNSDIVNFTVVMCEHLCGMGYQHVLMCYKLNIIESMQYVIQRSLQTHTSLLATKSTDDNVKRQIQYHSDLLKHACECYANILHSCIEKKDYKLHGMIAAQLLKTILTIVANPDPSVAASGCRTLWNLLYNNMSIYTQNDNQKQIKAVITHLLHLLSAQSQRARQNAAGCLWVIIDTVRYYYIIDIGQRLDIIIRAVTDSLQHFDTTYVLLSLLVALYSDPTSQTIKMIRDTEHIDAYRKIDVKLKERFVNPYNAHTILIKILSDPSVKAPTLHKCCDLITNVFWCMPAEQRTFVDSGILRVLGQYLKPERYDEFHTSYNKLSLAVLAICYQLDNLQLHISDLPDIMRAITQNIAVLPSPLNLSLALTMCCLLKQSSDIQNIFIQYGGLKAILHMLQPQQVASVNDTKLRKIVLSLITQICTDNTIIQNELYQMDGMNILIDCMSNPALLIYSVKAITVMSYQNQQVAQYLINQASVPSLTNPTQQTNIINVLIQCIAGLANRNETQDQLLFASCLSSICGTDTSGHLIRNVADKLLRNSAATETINKVCDWLKNFQKQQMVLQQEKEAQRSPPQTHASGQSTPPQRPPIAPTQSIPQPTVSSNTNPTPNQNNNNNKLPLPSGAAMASLRPQ